jgi:hypothetical protein
MSCEKREMMRTHFPKTTACIRAPISIITTENIFSAFVFAATFPKPTEVRLDVVKYKAVRYEEVMSVRFTTSYPRREDNCLNQPLDQEELEERGKKQLRRVYVCLIGGSGSVSRKQDDVRRHATGTNRQRSADCSGRGFGLQQKGLQVNEMRLTDVPVVGIQLNFLDGDEEPDASHPVGDQ